MSLREACVYIGSANSASSICIYDKRLERLKAGEEDPGHWVRVELRLKEGMAQAAASWVQRNADLSGADGLLRALLDFVVDDTDQNKSRRNSCDWWKEFCRLAGKLKLQPVKATKTLTERVAHWMRSHSATFAALQLAWSSCTGGDDLTARLTEDGLSRLRDRHIDMIGKLVNQWRTERGLAVGG